MALFNRPLKNKRIAILATDGFEKVELTEPVAALRSAGAKVDIISLQKGRIQGVNHTEPANRVKVNRTVQESRAEDYDGLLIPGGLLNPDMLRQSAAARDFAASFDELGKPIASICHGPWVLSSADLLEGRTLTSWPGIRDDLVNAGATWLDQPVVCDGNLVTSRSPKDMAPFVQAIIKHFAQVPGTWTETAEETDDVLISDPQHDTPPGSMTDGASWMPRPRTLAALGLVAYGLWRGTRRSLAQVDQS